MDIYLDQNVLGHILAGRYRLSGDSRIRWIFSTEHLNEIRRGEKLELLNVLKSMNAAFLEVLLDDKFKITGEARIHSPCDPHAIYQNHCEALDESGIDISVFHDLLAALFGSGEDLLNSYPAKLGEALMAPFRRTEFLDSALGDYLQEFGEQLGTQTAGLIGVRPPLEKQRKPFGLDRGRASSLADSDNPIQALWDHANKHLAAKISAEQFFGFEPIDKQGYEKWPEYLGIVSCYTLLNMIGFQPDKGLAKSKRNEAAASDASHVAHAAYCGVLISADTRLCSKARAIYRYRKIGTQVVDVSGAVGA